jgi:hypothetical protein
MEMAGRKIVKRIYCETMVSKYETLSLLLEGRG